MGPRTPRWWTAPVRHWVALALLLMLPALGLALWAGPDTLAALNWNRARLVAEPWRLWTAAWVHLSAFHLAGTLAAGALVALLGLAVPAGPRATLAWALAWPLSHLSLLAWPALQHYAGLSGVLHAGVAIMVVQLFRAPRHSHRWLAWTLGLGLLAKLLFETPWRAAVMMEPGWDIPVVPAAHLTGALWGAVLGWMLGRTGDLRRIHREGMQNS